MGASQTKVAPLPLPVIPTEYCHLVAAHVPYLEVMSNGRLVRRMKRFSSGKTVDHEATLYCSRGYRSIQVRTS